MSTNILKLIPTSPSYVPSEEAQLRARQLLTHYLPSAKKTTLLQTDRIRFVDAGSNWGRIWCPESETEIAQDKWQQAMDIAYEKEFRDLVVDLKCCGKVHSLNNLRYEWPIGFARFSIEVDSPDNDLQADQLQSLQQTLGLTLRKIWAHY